MEEVITTTLVSGSSSWYSLGPIPKIVKNSGHNLFEISLESDSDEFVGDTDPSPCLVRKCYDHVLGTWS
jgi:hypothetical protein